MQNYLVKTASSKPTIKKSISQLEQKLIVAETNQLGRRQTILEKYTEMPTVASNKVYTIRIAEKGKKKSSNESLIENILYKI